MIYKLNQKNRIKYSKHNYAIRQFSKKSYIILFEMLTYAM